MRPLASFGAVALWCVAASIVPAAVSAQDVEPTPPGRSQDRPISGSWVDVPIRDVLRAFAAYSGVSIVAGSGVSGTVTADIDDKPWDVALETILSVNGLVASEDAYGIIRVEDMANLDEREAVEPLLTRSYRISFSRATEIQAAIAPLLSSRGSASVVESSNTLIVTDIARVQRAIGGLLPSNPRGAPRVVAPDSDRVSTRSTSEDGCEEAAPPRERSARWARWSSRSSSSA
jgi:type IV pilus assembly protein PilQ